MQVFNGTIVDIKKIYPKEVDGKFYIVIVNEAGCSFYDADCNTYPDKKPYVCDTLEQAREYCDMMLEGIDAYEFSQRRKQNVK